MSDYYKTINLKINCSNYDYKRLKVCNRESAIIWNECVKINNAFYKDKKQLLNKNALQTFVKDINTDIICANNKQMISRKVYEAYKSISSARKSGRTELNYPYKEKKFYPTEWSYMFLFPDYNKNTIRLTTTRYIGEDNKPHNGKQIKLKFKYPLPQNIQTLKLVFKNGCFYACINYKVEINVMDSDGINVSSIDLGEIHSITSTDKFNNQLIITGRKIREIKQFRNKKYAELRSKMDKCKKGSRQRKKYKKALAKIKSKCNKQLYYCIHKLTKMYTDWAVEKGISTVYVGDITNIKLNIKSNSNVNQKINQWSYGQIFYYLKYKLNLQGIEILKVSEAYTSRKCPNCGKLNKIKDRNYKCKCGFDCHRDIVGAWNILNNNIDLDLELPNSDIKYLRIV